MHNVQGLAVKHVKGIVLGWKVPAMDTLKEIQSATLCIIGMCTRMSGGHYNVADGIKRIHGFVEAIDDKITTTDQTIRDKFA